MDQLIFPFKVKVLAVCSSDHCPILIYASNEIEEIRPLGKPFRYEANWVRREDCHEKVKNVWKGPFKYNSKIISTREGLNRCGHELSLWSEKCVAQAKGFNQ